jgi:hypothetical protein
MKSYFTTALLASTVLIPMPAMAQSASPEAARIEALETQLQQLQQAIADLKTAQASQAAQTAAAAQTAEAAQAAVKSAPKAEIAGWAANTKIGGKAFLNVSSIDHESDGIDQTDNGVQTDVKRFYVSVDHKFDNVFSANVTTDFRYNTNGTSKDVLVYVKKAFVQAKLSDAAIFRVGAADLPWVPFVEDLYGYRYVENVLIDRTKYGTSTDWGVHFSGSVMNGKLSYAASAINGAGYKTLSRSSNTIDLEGRVSFKPVDFLVFGVGGYTGKLGKSSDVTDTEHRATRVNAVAAYVGKRGRLGVEYFRAKNWNNVMTPFSDVTDGWSAFGTFNVNKKVALFGRYDWVDPNKRTNDSLRENYFNLGASYAVANGVDVALVYKRDRAENGFISTSNGTIGGIDDGTYDEFGVFTQIKF